LISDRAGSALLLAVLLAALAGPATARGGASGRQAGNAPPHPTEAQHSQQDSDDTGNAEFKALLASLGEKAAVYESIALRFVCVEQARSSEDKGYGKSYDYMYVEAEAQRYRPYRQKHSVKPNASTQEVDLDTPFPDSYSWTLMFDPKRQQLFHFQYVGREWYSLRDAHIIAFTAPLPFTSGRTIYEWSGKVWIDAENLNFLKVEAVPADQDDRLQQMLHSYRQSTRFLGMNLGHRPVGARYDITFLNQFQKLSLPDQAEYHQFVLDLEGDAELTGFQIQHYSDYQFFGVELHDRFIKQ
jgi:hypothetical protein